MKNLKLSVSKTAALDVYIPDTPDGRTRKSVVICPGGGYEFVSPREGEPVALQFLSKGFNAFVLTYTTPPEHHAQPLRELSDAVCLIRENADEWHADKIAVAGFSAGGHLAASLGVYWDDPALRAGGKNRPDGLILCYAVISSYIRDVNTTSFKNLLGGRDGDPALTERYALEKHISEKTPPAFLWHTFNDDGVSVAHAAAFIDGMIAKGVPVESHIFSDGPHGLSLGTKETSYEFGVPAGDTPHPAAAWMDLCIGWLDRL
ncbi:MAG: alpha/beta hydrolase [Oscillospiraceae bacterium]|jgi:acetyl esterase/lipase|nr:alpha/beta hydrolase [Oscillospiraceae bacterium]